ncbi:MAG: DUF1987 domain-containing protein [Bacteroidales bacterium]|nr:DUF1987 domain-containing protein [Bacteroidales bacterium]
MKPLFIEPTEFTPLIKFDPEIMEFEIGGFSRPENVSGFYNPVLEYLDEFEKNVLDSPSFKRNTALEVIFKLKYFNSASSKFILDIINTIIEFEDKGLKININWFYDEGDETILESGEDLSDIADVPFHYIIQKAEN